MTFDPLAYIPSPRSNVAALTTETVFRKSPSRLSLPGWRLNDWARRESNPTKLKRRRGARWGANWEQTYALNGPELH